MISISRKDSLNSDFYEPFRLMCRRRGEVLTRVESVHLSVIILPASLADLTEFLPAVTSTFYYVPEWSCGVLTATTGGNFRLRATNSGQGSAGDFEFLTNSAVSVGTRMSGFECDSLIYIKAGTTGGSSFLWAPVVYKITYQ